MLAADKDRLIANVKQNALLLRQRELEYYVERYSNLATQSSIIAGFAFDGLMEDIADGFEALGWWGRVRRKAVVTDSRWMHAWIRGVGSLVRQPEVKAFSAAQAAEALAWASVGSDQAAADQVPAPASAAR